MAERFCAGTQLIALNTKTGRKHFKGVAISHMIPQISKLLKVRVYIWLRFKINDFNEIFHPETSVRRLEDDGSLERQANVMWVHQSVRLKICRNSASGSDVF